MADLPYVKQGQGFWTVPLNKIIDMYNANGGGEVTHIDNPVNWTNGYTGESNAEVFKIGGRRLVYLRIRPHNKDNIIDSEVIGTLPDNIANDPTVSDIKLTGSASITFGSISDGNGDNGSVNIHIWPVKGTTALAYTNGAGFYIAKD